MSDDYTLRYDGWMQHQRGWHYSRQAGKVPSAARTPRIKAGVVQQKRWHARFRQFPLAVRQRLAQALAIVVARNDRAPAARLRRAS